MLKPSNARLQIATSSLKPITCLQDDINTNYEKQTKARKHSSNLNILRVCIAVCAGPRVVQVKGAFARATQVGTFIVAGCGFATSLLKLVLLDSLDAVTLNYPEVSAYAYVDDIDRD